MVGEIVRSESALKAAAAKSGLRVGQLRRNVSSKAVTGATALKAQTALVMLFPGPSRNEDARFAAEMIAGVASGLGGRFFDELRDKQSLGYTVHAGAIERSMGGAFMAYIATSPEKEEIARRGLLLEFGDLSFELLDLDPDAGLNGRTEECLLLLQFVQAAFVDTDELQHF